MAYLTLEMRSDYAKYVVVGRSANSPGANELMKVNIPLPPSVLNKVFIHINPGWHDHSFQGLITTAPLYLPAEQYVSSEISQLQPIHLNHCEI